MQLTKEKEDKLLALEIEDERIAKMLKVAIPTWKRVGFRPSFGSWYFTDDLKFKMQKSCCLISAAADNLTVVGHSLEETACDHYGLTLLDVKSIINTFDIPGSYHHKDVAKIRDVLFHNFP